MYATSGYGRQDTYPGEFIRSVASVKRRPAQLELPARVQDVHCNQTHTIGETTTRHATQADDVTHT